MARAQKAQLGGKDMWKKYPRQMLRSRVVSEGVRTVYPERDQRALRARGSARLRALQDPRSQPDHRAGHSHACRRRLRAARFQAPRSRSGAGPSTSRSSAASLERTHMRGLYQRNGIFWARFKVRGHEYRVSLRTRSERVAERRLKIERQRIEDAAYFGASDPVSGRRPSCPGPSMGPARHQAEGPAPATRRASPASAAGSTARRSTRSTTRC
jgi:hypothetical protein